MEIYFHVFDFIFYFSICLAKKFSVVPHLICILFFFSHQHSYKVACAANHKETHSYSDDLQTSFCEAEIGEKFVTFTISITIHFGIAIIVKQLETQ